MMLRKHIIVTTLVAFNGQSDKVIYNRNEAL